MMQKLRNNGMVSQPGSQGIKQHWKKWGSFDFKLGKIRKLRSKPGNFNTIFKLTVYDLVLRKRIVL